MQGAFTQGYKPLAKQCDKQVPVSRPKVGLACAGLQNVVLWVLRWGRSVIPHIQHTLHTACSKESKHYAVRRFNGEQLEVKSS